MNLHCVTMYYICVKYSDTCHCVALSHLASRNDGLTQSPPTGKTQNKTLTVKSKYKFNLAQEFCQGRDIVQSMVGEIVLALDIELQTHFVQCDSCLSALALVIELN